MINLEFKFAIKYMQENLLKILYFGQICYIITKLKKGEGKEVAYCSIHNTTLMAGRLYATSIGGNFNANLISQTYSSNSGLREPDVVTGVDSANFDFKDDISYSLAILNDILGTSFSVTTSEENEKTANTDMRTYLQEEYNEIVKSVYLNEGFYVGRYETSGITTVSTDYNVAVVEGTYPSIHMDWYYMYAQQVTYAEKNHLNVGSTMIQGAAYDQIMKFVDGAKDGAGNTYNVTTYSPERHVDGETKTGMNLNDKVKNIFDLEGNFYTWTTEASEDGFRIGRGGCSDFVEAPASSRSNYTPGKDLHNSVPFFGTVIQLYIK